MPVVGAVVVAAVKLGVKQLVDGVADEAERRAGHGEWPRSRGPSADSRSLDARKELSRQLDPQKFWRDHNRLCLALAAVLVSASPAIVDRLRVAEATGRRPQPRRRLQTGETEKSR